MQWIIHVCDSWTAAREELSLSRFGAEFKGFLISFCCSTLRVTLMFSGSVNGSGAEWSSWVPRRLTFPFHLRAPVAKQSLATAEASDPCPRTLSAIERHSESGHNYYSGWKGRKDFKYNSVKLGNNEALFPPLNGSGVFVRLTEDEARRWRSSRKTSGFSSALHSDQRKGFFPSLLFSHLCLHLK